MTSSDDHPNRRSVLRRAGAGLAVAAGLATASSAAAGEHAGVPHHDFEEGDRVVYRPCEECDSCNDLMTSPPGRGYGGRDGPTVCEGARGVVLDTVPGGYGDQFVEVGFWRRPPVALASHEFDRPQRKRGWVYGGALEEFSIDPR